jgi:hypothetical protein
MTRSVASARQPISNLVKNYNFENSPPFTAAQTSGVNRWINGTASGGVHPTGQEYCWGVQGITGSVAIQYDTSIYHSGSASMKLSTTASGAAVSVSPSKGVAVEDRNISGIPVLPSTSYTLTYWMKTNFVSGDATSGATLQVRERNGTFGTVTDTNGTLVKTTTDWTQYSIVITTGATTRFILPYLKVTGNDGTATLIMDAWFDDIVLTPTTPITRTAVV